MAERASSKTHLREFVLMVLGVGLALPIVAKDEPNVEKVTVEQLEQALAATDGKPDAKVAQQLQNMELTERMSPARLSHLKAELPGTKAQEALMAVADMSAFLDAPQAEIPAGAEPDAAALSQMMVQIAKYVIETVHQLPNFIATRDTTGFEDTPQEVVQAGGGRGNGGGAGTLYDPMRRDWISNDYQPLHVVERSSLTVTYRDHQEVEDQAALKDRQRASKLHGMVTKGEFGPIVSMVVKDAIRSTITWSHWERRADGTEAVFHYEVPREKSHYVVQFCCVANKILYNDLPGGNLMVPQIFSERAAYHGEIGFDPSSGAILRVTLEAAIRPNGPVTRAGVLVEYGPVEIGGKNYVCPARSVAVLVSHAQQPPAKPNSEPSYTGPATTFLNDVAFSQYHRFGAETRILPRDSQTPEGNGPASVPVVAPPKALGTSPSQPSSMPQAYRFPFRPPLA
jgi:hypothetical protein